MRNLREDDIRRLPVSVLIKYCEEDDNYDLLDHVSEKQLFTEVSEGKTLMQYMIDKKKEGKDVHLEKIEFYDIYSTSEITAKKLMMMAKNDVVGYVPKIDPDLLLFTGVTDTKSTLELLLEMDKELTVSKIIPERFIHNPEIVFRLELAGVEETYVKVSPDKEEFSDVFLRNANAGYADNCHSPCEDMLCELKVLFYNDGYSDKKIIDSLILSYRYYTSTNYWLAIEELKRLIEIKKANPDKFIYRRTNEGAFFSRVDGGTYYSKNIITSINHETTHALHFYLSDFYAPPDFEEVMENVKNDKKTLERVRLFSEWFNEQRSIIREKVEKRDFSKYYEEKYSGDRKVQLAKFLSSLKNEQRKRYEDDYLPEVLDIVLAKTYSVDEYIENRQKIEREELVSAIVKTKLDVFSAIGDIIDAVYEGKYRHDILEDEKGEVIPHTFGHGIDYYSNKERRFNEVIANYGVILKSKRAKEGIELLRIIVGHKLVDMIDQTYKVKIIGSKDVKTMGDNSYGSR